jgi:hypothetical protein
MRRDDGKIRDFASQFVPDEIGWLSGNNIHCGAGYSRNLTGGVRAIGNFSVRMPQCTISPSAGFCA